LALGMGLRAGSVTICVFLFFKSISRGEHYNRLFKSGFPVTLN